MSCLVSWRPGRGCCHSSDAFDLWHNDQNSDSAMWCGLRSREQKLQGLPPLAEPVSYRDRRYYSERGAVGGCVPAPTVLSALLKLWVLGFSFVVTGVLLLVVDGALGVVVNDPALKVSRPSDGTILLGFLGVGSAVDFCREDRVDECVGGQVVPHHQGFPA
ncbi:hypothetical protein KCU88_g279, partial [Aureobasidium melanogenum]